MCENVVNTEALEKCMHCALDCREHSTYCPVGVQRLAEPLHSGRDRRTSANVHYLSLQCKVLSLRNKVDKLVIAIHTSKTQRVAALLEQHLSRGALPKILCPFVGGDSKMPPKWGHLFLPLPHPPPLRTPPPPTPRWLVSRTDPPMPQTCRDMQPIRPLVGHFRVCPLL